MSKNSNETFIKEDISSSKEEIISTKEVSKENNRFVKEFAKEFVKENNRFAKEKPFTKEFVKASRQICELIIQNPHISAKEMSNSLNITPRQIQKYLKRLKDIEKISRKGSRKQGEWIILDRDFINFLNLI